MDLLLVDESLEGEGADARGVDADVQAFAGGANLVPLKAIREEISVGIDSLEGDVRCRCDDARKGDFCEEAATCDEYTGWTDFEGALVVEGCSGAGTLGASTCVLGCEEGFYQVSKSDGLCLADRKSVV